MNTKRNIFLSLAALAFTLALTSTSAFSNEELFNALDTDADGLISKSEAQSHEVLSELFDTLDINSDSFISPDEFAVANLEK
jgi:Ca2+-binding EF-hand superfamily protein